MNIEEGNLKVRVSEEYSIMKNWRKLGQDHNSCLMFDSESGKIWTDCFVNQNDHFIYRRKTIHPVPVSVLIAEHTTSFPMTDNDVIEAVTAYIKENCTNPSVFEEPK